MPGYRTFTGWIRWSANCSYRIIIVFCDQRDLFAGRSVTIYDPVIILFQLFSCTIRIIQPFFDIRAMRFYFFKMQIDVFIRHGKANEFDRLKILLIETVSPIKRDITALDNEVLLILNSSLYDLSNDWPKVICQFIIIFRCEIRIAAADKPHLQMVNRKIRVFGFLKHPLRQNRFPHMGCSCYNDYHIYLNKLGFNLHTQ